MDVRIIPLANETDVDSRYGVLSLDEFNGTYSRRVADTASTMSGFSWLGKLALGLLLSSFVVVALAGNLLVIVAVVTDRNLRRTSNYFIVSSRFDTIPACDGQTDGHPATISSCRWR